MAPSGHIHSQTIVQTSVLNLCRVPSWKRSHIPSQPALLKMMFLSRNRWDMIVPWRVLEIHHFFFACYLLVQCSLRWVFFLPTKFLFLTYGFLDICLPPPLRRRKWVSSNEIPTIHSWKFTFWTEQGRLGRWCSFANGVIFRFKMWIFRGLDIVDSQLGSSLSQVGACRGGSRWAQVSSGELFWCHARRHG